MLLEMKCAFTVLNRCIAQSTKRCIRRSSDKLKVAIMVLMHEALHNALGEVKLSSKNSVFWIQGITITCLLNFLKKIFSIYQLQVDY